MKNPPFPAGFPMAAEGTRPNRPSLSHASRRTRCNHICL
jgi:hypothetical protein